MQLKTSARWRKDLRFFRWLFTIGSVVLISSKKRSLTSHSEQVGYVMHISVPSMENKCFHASEGTLRCPSELWWSARQKVPSHQVLAARYISVHLLTWSKDMRFYVLIGTALELYLNASGIFVLSVGTYLSTWENCLKCLNLDSTWILFWLCTMVGATTPRPGTNIFRLSKRLSRPLASQSSTRSPREVLVLDAELKLLKITFDNVAEVNYW